MMQVSEKRFLFPAACRSICGKACLSEDVLIVLRLAAAEGLGGGKLRKEIKAYRKSKLFRK